MGKPQKADDRLARTKHLLDKLQQETTAFHGLQKAADQRIAKPLSKHHTAASKKR